MSIYNIKIYSFVFYVNIYFVFYVNIYFRILCLVNKLVQIENTVVSLAFYFNRIICLLIHST